MFTPKPPRSFEHPTYGRFEAEHGEQCWIAALNHRGAQLRVSVLGSEVRPDETRLQTVDQVLSELTSLRAKALDFIVGTLPESRRHGFTLTGIDFGCISGLDPGDFELEFARAGQDGVIWSVVFVDGVPTNLGREG